MYSNNNCCFCCDLKNCTYFALSRARRGESEQESEQDLNHDTTSPESGDSSGGDEEVVISEFSSSETDSTDYSDWVMDQPGQVLKPPKRSKRRPVRKMSNSPQNGNSANSGQSTPVKKKVSNAKLIIFSMTALKCMDSNKNWTI